MKPIIEPMLSLAMSMQSNKGVYALLLGSGISRSAGILTGWGITIDLINQIRAIHSDGETGDPDPETWYINTYKKEPDYSDLLDGIAKTPASRSKLLKSYFEPTEEEREEGKKLPTIAHKAIAKLVAKGYIKVIITTKFDRLLEQALEAEGVTPQIISNSNKINSAFPIVHHDCTIVKVHGDYIEADTKNTVTELAEYDEALNKYLDRIFDEFGLIISGWSAEWDIALRNAIMRCPNHRFATYWTDRGRRNDKAQDLIDHRRAKKNKIKVPDADSFFQELEEKVTSLEEINQNHPLDAKVAVQTLKRYLAEDKYRIRLHDLVMDEAHRTCKNIYSTIYDSDFYAYKYNFHKRLEYYESITNVSIQFVINGCYLGNENQNTLWIKYLNRITHLHENRLISPFIYHAELNDYYPLVTWYALGIALVAQDKYSIFKQISTEVSILKNGIEEPLGFSLSAWHGNFAKELEDYKTQRQPTSLYIYKLLWSHFKEFIFSEVIYRNIFDRFEYLTALIFTDMALKRHKSYIEVPLGSFAYRKNIISEIANEIEEHKNNWFPLKEGLFDGDAKYFLEVKKVCDASIKNMSSGYSWLG